jgi:hypothetical protein
MVDNIRQAARVRRMSTSRIWRRSGNYHQPMLAFPCPGELAITEPAMVTQNIVHVPSAKRTKHTLPFHNSHPPSNCSIAPLKVVSFVRDNPRHRSAQAGKFASQP